MLQSICCLSDATHVYDVLALRAEVIFYGFQSSSLYRCDFNTSLVAHLGVEQSISGPFTGPYNMSEMVILWYLHRLGCALK